MKEVPKEQVSTAGGLMVLLRSMPANVRINGIEKLVIEDHQVTVVATEAKAPPKRKARK